LIFDEVTDKIYWLLFMAHSVCPKSGIIVIVLNELDFAIKLGKKLYDFRTCWLSWLRSLQIYSY